MDYASAERNIRSAIRMGEPAMSIVIKPALETIRKDYGIEMANCLIHQFNLTQRMGIPDYK
jgi:hypothetical protein